MTRARTLELLRAMSPAERLARALALTSLVRDLVWQGALLHADDRGAGAVVERFLQQLHGPGFDARIALARRPALPASE